MSGSVARTVGIRVSTEGADRARRELEQFGTAGEAALRRVNAASTAASPSLQTMAGASDALVRSLGGLPGPLGTVGRQLGGMQAGLGGVAGGFSLAAAAGTAMGAALVAGFGASVAAAETFERLGLRTEAVIRATGGAAGVSAQQIREMAQEIARSTLASTAGVEAAAQQLLTFRSVAGDTFARTLRAAQDLASVGFGTIDSAAVQLGKALENPAQGLTALTRVGVTFTGQQKELIESLMATGRAAEAQRVILAAVEQQVGGAGRAEAGGLAGAFDTLGQNVEEFLARIGNTGPLQAATWAIDKIALAVKGLDDALKAVIGPSDPAEVAMAAVQAAQRRLEAVQAQNRAERRANAYGDLPRAYQQAEMVAHDELTLALARLEEVREAARRETASREARAAAARATAEREASETAIKALEQSLDQRVKLRADHQKRLAQIDEAERTGARTAQEAAALRVQVTAAYTKALADLDREGRRAAAAAEREEKQRAKALEKLEQQRDAAERMRAATMAGSDATEALAVQLEIENHLREAGISLTRERTAAEDAYAQAVTQTITATKAAEAATRKIDEARREADQRVKSTTDDVVRYAGDRFADLFSRTGRGWAGLMDDFYRLARQTFARIAAEAVIRPIVTPVVQGIFGGGISSAGGAGSGGGSLGSLLGLGNIGEMLGLTGQGGLLSGLGSSLGLTGAGGLLGATAITGWGTSTNAALAAMGGVYGPATPAAVLAQGGGGLMGGAGATFGSLLGGAGAGFGAGMLLNSLLGGNQTSGMIGSGGGALAGAIIGSIVPGIGTLIGGLIGGAAGGGLGGLFGPGPSVRGWGLRLQSAGRDDAGRDEFADRLLPIDRRYYNDSGAAVFQQADQLVATLNAYLAQNKLQVGGVSIVGGNRNGPDYSWADAGSLSEAFTRLRFSSQDNAALGTYLGGQVFDDPAKLAAAVEGFKTIQAVIDALTAEAVPAFTAQLKAVNDNFDAAVEGARRYGLAEDALATARAKTLDAMQAQRTETLRQGEVALAIRRLAAEGNTEAADLARQTEAARQETRAFTEQLEVLAISAAEKSRLLVELEETQAAERAAIITRYAAQARDALLRTGGAIRTYVDGLRAGASGGASPTDQLVEAQNAFGRDLALARGGDGDALSRITQTADTLLAAGRGMFASGTDFQALRQFVIASLENLPATQSYDAQILAALQQLGGSLNVAVGIELIRVITEALNALPDADRARLVQTATVLRTVEERLGRLLSDVEVDALVQGAVVRRDIEQSMERDLSVAERAGLVQAADITRAIQQAMARDLSPAERAGLVYDADITRAIQQAMGRDLSVAERAGLVQAADITRAIQQAIGRDLSPAERAGLVYDADITRVIQQAMGRDLTDAERAGLVQGGGILRSIEQAIGRNLSEAERDSLVQGASIARIVEQALGRDLTAAERAGLVQGGSILRSIEQAIGRNLSDAERDSLVQGAAIERTISQAIGRDLTADERAGLIQAASVVRTVEQQLGRVLTDAERTLVIESAIVTRGINQTIFAPTGTIVVPENEAVLRGIFQQVLAATGAQLLTDESITRIIRQAVETTETIQISRSIDDKLSGLLTTANAILATMRDDIAATRGFTDQMVQNTQTLIDGRPGDGGEGGGGSFALGGVFAGGNVVPFARGGIPDLVNQPTLAPMALFGEAGPEAIMPLARRGDGSLGVRATMPAASDSLRADLQALRQEVADLRQVLREAAVLIAGEVRAGTSGTTEAVQKLRNTVRDAA